MEYIEGGVTAAKGFKASSAAAGIKYQGRTDMAMESGDRELILASMQGISNIVTKSPLDELEQFAKVFNNPDLPLLDF